MKNSIKRFKQIIFAVAFLTAISAINISAATFTVTNTNDSGAGSLRQAITDANAAAGADTVVFDQSFNQPRTITLLSVINFSPAPNEATTVVGPGANLLTISGGGNLGRMFGSNANFPHTFSISGLTLTGAAGDGGRNIDIASSVVTANISNCVFTNNSVSAIYNDGNLTVTNSVFNQNTSVTFGAIYNTRSLTATGSTFTNNVSTGSGGAIYSSSGTATVTNSIFTGNRATGTGTDNGAGGAIFFFPGTSSSGTMTITNSTFINNSSNSGGGAVFNTFGTMNINGSLFAGNRAGVSGAGQNTEGGAIANFGDARMTITNSTINGNQAPRGGGVSHTPNNPNSLTIVNSTIVNNSATSVATASGGGIYVGNRFLPTATMNNTIVANNSPNDIFNEPDDPFSSASYNLIKNPVGFRTVSGTGNIFNVDPLLAPLAVNGGAIRTRALRPGSPAIDAGDPANFPPTDQRGVARPQGARADIGAYERRAIDFTLSGFADFDGDGRADVSVFRPSNGVWYLQQSSAGFTGVQFGQNGDALTPADYDGDGKTDVAVFRVGIWYLLRSSQGFTGFQFGQTGDIPAPGDYDGDGRADLAVFRPSNGTWYLQRSTSGFTGVQFGQSGDKPVAADYDGDGRTDVAINRAGTWYLNRSTAGFTGIQFGTADDRMVPADYDGDGLADVAVFRPSNGTWYLQRSQAGFTGIQFGASGDLPAAADYDGDGRADVAVFRSGTWYLNRSTSGFTGVSFGAATDAPVPNAFVP